MKRAITVLVLCLGAVSLAARAQEYTTNLDGYGGLGVQALQGSFGPAHTSAMDWFRYGGLNTFGFVYDPRLATYSFGVSYNASNASSDTTNFRSGGLGYNGQVSLLAGRSFPVQAYFSRSNTDFGSYLLPTLTTHVNLWGIRGGWNNPAVANFTYDFGKSSTSTEGRGLATSYATDNTFFTLGATRKLKAWDLRLQDSWSSSRSSFTSGKASSNLLVGSGWRTFAGDKVRTELTAERSSYDSSSSDGSNGSTITQFTGDVQWRVTKKLEAGLDATLMRNSFNSLAALSQVNGVPSQAPAVTEPSTGIGIGAGLGYAVTNNLTVGGSAGLSHNSMPAATQQSLLDAGLLVVTGSRFAGGNAAYRRRFWKLEYGTGGRYNRQDYTTVGRQSPATNSYSFYNRVSGGNARTIAFSVSQTWSKNSVSQFLTLNDSRQDGFTAEAHTTHWGFMDLQGHLTWQTMSFVSGNANWNSTLKNAGVAVNLPKQKLNLAFQQSFSDSNQLLMFLNAITPQGLLPGEPGLPPPDLLTPTIINAADTTNLSVVWSPSLTWGVTGRVGRSSNSFLLNNKSWTGSRHFDLQGYYKFGRFTFHGGFTRTNWNASGMTNGQMWNMVTGSVQFPFHLLGNGY